MRIAATNCTRIHTLWDRMGQQPRTQMDPAATLMEAFDTEEGDQHHDNEATAAPATGAAVPNANATGTPISRLGCAHVDTNEQMHEDGSMGLGLNAPTVWALGEPYQGIGPLRPGTPVTFWRNKVNITGAIIDATWSYRVVTENKNKVVHVLGDQITPATFSAQQSSAPARGIPMQRPPQGQRTCPPANTSGARPGDQRKSKTLGRPAPYGPLPTHCAPADRHSQGSKSHRATARHTPASPKPLPTAKCNVIPQAHSRQHRDTPAESTRARRPPASPNASAPPSRLRRNPVMSSQEKRDAVDQKGNWVSRRFHDPDNPHETRPYWGLVRDRVEGSRTKWVVLFPGRNYDPLGWETNVMTREQIRRSSSILGRPPADERAIFRMHINDPNSLVDLDLRDSGIGEDNDEAADSEE
jgi:hypothetical protein